MGSTVSAPAGALPSEEAIVKEMVALLQDAGGEKGASQLFSLLYPRLRGSREVINMAGKTRAFLAKHADTFERVADGAGGVVRLKEDVGALQTWGDQAEEDERRLYHQRRAQKQNPPPDVRTLAPPSKNEAPAAVSLVTPQQRPAAAAASPGGRHEGARPEHSGKAHGNGGGGGGDGDGDGAARITQPSHDRTHHWVNAMLVSPPDHVECVSPAASAPSCASPAPSGASSVPSSARAAEAVRLARAAADSVAAASAMADALRQASQGQGQGGQGDQGRETPQQCQHDISTRGQPASSPPLAAAPQLQPPEYPAGCWSPTNPDGARVYSIPFLLHFRAACANLTLDDPLLRSMQAGSAANRSQQGWAYGSYHGGLARFQQAPPMRHYGQNQGWCSL